MVVVQPVILCGGSGTRLWPLSTSSLPKQFITIDGISLLQATINRILHLQSVFSTILNPILIMHQDHANLEECHHLAKKYLIVTEPYANDTAVAVSRALSVIKDQNAVILALPADHSIDNVDNFIRDIIVGLNTVTDSNIVLFGLTPTSPETKYGYILPTNPVSFKEKPSLEIASNLIQEGALWNSGLFAGRVGLISSLLKNLDDWVKNPHPGKAPSFDVAVLQEYKNINCVKCENWGWDDVGTWEAFTSLPSVQKEITTKDSIRLLDRHTKGNIIILGCSDLLVVRNGDNILIMDMKKDHSTELKNIASNL